MVPVELEPQWMVCCPAVTATLLPVPVCWTVDKRAEVCCVPSFSHHPTPPHPTHLGIGLTVVSSVVARLVAEDPTARGTAAEGARSLAPVQVALHVCAPV